MKAVVASAILLAASAPAPAAAQDPLSSMGFITGTCERLVVRGEDASGDCGPTVVNLTYRSGRSSFAFMDGDRRMISFSGTSQTGEGDTARQTLDLITVARRTGSGENDVAAAGIPASGTCEFSNPFRGTPAFIRCTARTAEGEFTSSFTSNGEAPSIQRF